MFFMGRNIRYEALTPILTRIRSMTTDGRAKSSPSGFGAMCGTGEEYDITDCNHLSQQYILKQPVHHHKELPIKNRILILAVFTAASSLSAAWIDLSPDTLQKWITIGTSFDFILIDIRRGDELDVSKIIGTDSCIPYNIVWPDNFKTRIVSVPKSAYIVIYCAAGVRSVAACDYLDSLSYQHVYNLPGGYNEWGSRATLASTRVKPLSVLPAPSMKARKPTAVRIAGGQPNRNRPVSGRATVSLSGSTIRSAVHCPHLLLNGSRAGDQTRRMGFCSVLVVFKDSKNPAN